MSEELRASLYAFELIRTRGRRPAGAPDQALARPVTKVGVVGAGLMAGQLALLFARQLQVPVVLTDVDQQRLDAGVARVHAEIAASWPSGAGSQRRPGQPAHRGRHRLASTTRRFADADFVIEAVFEELSIKQAVFAELEKHVDPAAILATNTSSLSITAMAAGLRAPGAGRRLPLLQPGRRAAAGRGRARRAHRRRHRWPPRSPSPPACARTPCWCSDAPGFVVNRLLTRLLGEVIARHRRGHADRGRRRGAGLRSGLPMSPFQLLAWSARPSPCTWPRRCTRPSRIGSRSAPTCAGWSRPASPVSTSGMPAAPPRSRAGRHVRDR